MKKEHTPIELYVINAVRNRRLELDISPSDLSLAIGLSDDFISRVEQLIPGYSYDINHLNELAKVLKCRVAVFFPDAPLENDCI